jgi:hypothetical protein
VTNAPAVPAGWYPDHTGAPQSRWWDGDAWTDRVRPEDSVPESRMPDSRMPDSPAPYAMRRAPASVPDGTRVYNVFIWIIVLLPIVNIATLLTYDVSSIATTPTDPYAVYRDPAYLGSLALGWIAYLGSALVAYFDRSRLLRDGYDRPFHWTWAFLGGGVYVIGRSVIVHRRSGRGLAPIWAWAGLTAFAVVITVLKVIAMVSTMMSIPALTS